MRPDRARRAQGVEHAELWQGAHTVADGLRVPIAVGDFLMLRAIRASGGTAIAVSDDALLAQTRRLGGKSTLLRCVKLISGELKLGGPPEFPEREDNKAVLAAYSFDPKFGGENYVQLDAGSLRYEALTRGDIDVMEDQEAVQPQPARAKEAVQIELGAWPDRATVADSRPLAREQRQGLG